MLLYFHVKTVKENLRLQSDWIGRCGAGVLQCQYHGEWPGHFLLSLF